MAYDIKGYTDVLYVKGQYYKVAASPMPVVFTGNIDTISDDLLTRAMYVSKSQSDGTFPNDFGNNFLIITVRYGNNTYLQTAYMIENGYECYEYRRIYSGEWTDWIGLDSEIKVVDDKIQNVKDVADSCNQAINGTNGLSAQVSSMSSSISSINNSLGSVSSRVTSMGNSITSLEAKTSSLGAVQLYDGVLRSGSVTFNDSYTAYLVVGMVLNGGSRTSILHPRKQITTTAVKYLLADPDEWVRYILKDNGNHQLSLTFDGKSASYQGGGAILQIWGIN